MNRTPKEKFQASSHRLAHEQVVMTDAFQAACDYSLLQLQGELHADPNKSVDVNQSADFHAQMVGAQRVLAILKTIHELPEYEVKPGRPILNYKAGV